MRVLAPLAAFLMIPVPPVAAQEPPVAAEAESGIGGTPSQGRIRLSAPDGAETRDYPLESFSLSASLSPADDGRAETSLMLSLAGIPDPFLLRWMQLGQADGKARTMVIETASPGGKTSPLIYEMEGARVASFTMGGGYRPETISVTLQIHTSSLSINGVPMR